MPTCASSARHPLRLWVLLACSACSDDAESSSPQDAGARVLTGARTDAATRTPNDASEQVVTKDAGLDAARAEAATDAAVSDAGSTAQPAQPADDDAGVPDPAARLTWQRAAECPVARFEAGSLWFKDELWVLGGFVTQDLAVTRRVDIYDPAHDSWRRGPSLPGAETHFGIVADEDALLVFGGLQGGASNPAVEVWRLPAGASEWSRDPDLPGPRAAFAWGVIGRNLHIAGGLGADNNTDIASHIVRDLSGNAGWQDAAALPDPRNHGGAAVVGGKLYAVAGRHMWDENAGHTTSLHAFDPTRGVWQPLAALPSARSEISAATLTTSDGRIITVGGSTAGVMPSRDVLEYDSHSNRWRALPNLPEPRKGAVAARAGKRLVVTTGSPTSTDPASTTFVGCCIED
jgi:N-acetylneuraminic acid mutarotase